MKKITDVSELRHIQMDILKYVDTVCRENGIKYSLAGGTLIGAVRHKGYIPWDDDIDIMLVRDEYEKLIDVLSKNYNDNSTPYRILTHSKEKKYLYPFAKVIDTRTILRENLCGGMDLDIYIDIFPMDSIPYDEGKPDKTINRIRCLYNILMIKRLKYSTHRPVWKNLTITLSRLVLFPISYNCIINKIERKAVSFSNVKPCRRACLVWCYGNKGTSYSVHDIYIELPFENEKFMVIADYHTYLSNVYGNYMELPSEDKQIPHHRFEAYWK
ncbi:MAG: LicD family protein [Bacteroidaceae bacterium]|nr:LicD family protein [Bacteroidaceae bacterium]